MPRPHYIPILLFGGSLAAQSIAPGTAAIDRVRAHVSVTPNVARDQVLFDDRGDEGLWAGGNDWKASFTKSGFTFVPFLGSEAPRNFPVSFRLASVAVDGQPVQFSRDAVSTRQGRRLTFDRGGVREIYDLAPSQVEQTFVVETPTPGDVVVTLEVATDLVEDPARDGLQFVNELGGVGYGEAALVRGGERVALATSWDGRAIAIRVPAALRDRGPVVIDPIVNTVPARFGNGAPMLTTGFPDVAYEGANDVYMMVWESVFSATDIDVLCELFDTSGLRIDGSGAVIDYTTSSYALPRVASRRDVGRFLVTVEGRNTPGFGLRTMVFGRARDAGGARTVYPMQLVSDPTHLGLHYQGAVGGDPGPAAGSLGWCVTWIRAAPGYHAIHQRYLDAFGVPSSPDQVLHTSNTPLEGVQISRSNSRGLVPVPGWLVVCAASLSSTQRHILAWRIDQSGIVTGPLSMAAQNDLLYPSVTSAGIDRDGLHTRYVVTGEEQVQPAAVSFVVTADANALTASPAQYFSRPQFAGPFWVRAETDGYRYVVTSSIDGDASRIGVTSYGANQSGITALDGQQELPHGPSFPRLVSKWTGGRTGTQFTIAFAGNYSQPNQPLLTYYRSHSRTTGVELSTPGCANLGIGWMGDPLLGSFLSFHLTNLNGELSGFAIGDLAAAPTPLCPQCNLGVDVNGPITLLFGTGFLVTVPTDADLLGVHAGVQGFAVGQGPCSGIRLSDLLDVEIG